MDADRSPDVIRPRRKRIPAAEVQERMLQAAQDFVLETGVTISLEEISLEDIMRRAEVPRSSVYRLWAYKGDFLVDLLCRLAEPDWAGTAQQVKQQRALDVAWAVVNASQPMLTTPDGRRAVSREAIRRAVEVSFQDMAADPAWPIYMALTSTIGNTRDPQARTKIAEALEEFERQRVDSLVRFFEKLAVALGIRLRPGFSLEHLAVATGSLMQGLLLRTLIVKHTKETAPRPSTATNWSLDQIINAPIPGPGLADEASDWSLVAIAYLGILETMTEHDPDADLLVQR